MPTVHATPPVDDREHFDGSPWGGGATPSCGVPLGQAREAHPRTEFWQQPGSEEDATLSQAVVGDPGSQALWEAYSLVAAVYDGRNKLSSSEDTILFCGDALGALQDAVS